MAPLTSAERLQGVLFRRKDPDRLMVRPRRADSAGVVLAALLALTGCGAGGDSASGEEASSGGPSAESSAEDADTPDVPEAPAYAEIETDLWDTMQQADSVAITGEMPGTFLNSEDDGEVRLVYEFSGAVDGSDATYRAVRDETVISRARLVGDAYYEPAPILLGSLSRAVESTEIPERARDEAAGKWVEWEEEEGVESRTTERFLEHLRRALEGRDPLVTFDGETRTRDGEEVWVYSDGVFEVVVRPGEEPVLLSCVGDARDGTFELTFSDWNSSEGPGAPPEQKTMPRAELGELLAG
ncbi:hypothetical protein [Nesterenkonia halobia]|uniref:Lipoprotein n=1 Tax=Nesterenkonia halobia TaxID=37922 RepID=A0ABP6RC59_9MICC